jgi:hypothetical protein
MMERADAALNRKAWGLLLAALVLAAAWFGVNLLGPGVVVGPVPLRLGFVLAWNAVLLYGLWRALARSDFSPGGRVAAWLTGALVLAAWITVAWALAVNGVFRRDLFGNVPTLPIAIVLPILVGSLVLTRSKAVGSLLDTTPASWLVGVQVYRVLGAAFLVSWIRGTMPGAFALPAGVGDVATGLLALPAAVWVASGLGIGRRIGVRWNVLGLVDFAVAVMLGMLTSPGPAHLLARDHPNTAIAAFPAAMTPAFVVPFSTLLHVLSLRQLKRAARRGSSAAEEPRLVNGVGAMGAVAN